MEGLSSYVHTRLFYLYRKCLSSGVHGPLPVGQDVRIICIEYNSQKQCPICVLLRVVPGTSKDPTKISSWVGCLLAFKLWTLIFLVGLTGMTLEGR